MSGDCHFPCRHFIKAKLCQGFRSSHVLFLMQGHHLSFLLPCLLAFWVQSWDTFAGSQHGSSRCLHGQRAAQRLEERVWHRSSCPGWSWLSWRWQTRWARLGQAPQQGLGRVCRSHKYALGQCADVKPCTDVFSVRSPSQGARLQLPWVCLKELWSHLQLYCPVHPRNVQKMPV